MNHDSLLKEQTDYYRARSGEYDEWFFRQGRYDRRPELNQRWFAEVETVCRALDAFKPAGKVLEMACGTGIWTKNLLEYAGGVTAVDASKEMLAINRVRTQSTKVRYVQADLFTWQPDGQYDVVFFAFWLSHVPPERFDDFWKLVAAATKPNGWIFFIDSQYESTSTANDHKLKSKKSISVTRLLNDGRKFQIVKVFYEAEQLANRLSDLGWNCIVAKTPTYFLYGSGNRV